MPDKNKNHYLWVVIFVIKTRRFRFNDALLTKTYHMAKVPTSSDIGNSQPKISKKNWKIPNEVLRHLLVNKSTHLGRTYLYITRDRDFSGHIKEEKIPLLAKKLKSTKATIAKHLRQLTEIYLLEQHGSLFMAVGADEFASRCGVGSVKFCPPLQDMSRTHLTTLAYAMFSSEEFHKKTYRRRTKALPAPTDTERNKPLGAEEETQGTTQDINDGLKRTQISNSYTQAHIYRRSRTKRSIQTISMQRCRAKKLGMLDYERSFHMKEQVSFGDNGEKTITNMVGGPEIAHRYNMAKLHGDLNGNEVLSKRKDGTFAWFVEHPALFFDVLKFTRRGISKKRAKRATERYMLYNTIK